MLCGYTFFIFFFFQAEDGIRDYRVTGVQTCALPIRLNSSHTIICMPSSGVQTDRKSTRLNSSHTIISYAVFCLKKKKKKNTTNTTQLSCTMSAPCAMSESL